MYRLFIMCLLLGVCSGCWYTENYQAATCRTVGDILTTTALEQSNVDENTRAQVQIIAGKIYAYLLSESIETLSTAAITSALKDKIPDNYEQYFTKVFNLIGNNSSSIVSSKSLRLAQNSVYGIVTGSTFYEVKISEE